MNMHVKTPYDDDMSHWRTEPWSGHRLMPLTRASLFRSATRHSMRFRSVCFGRRRRYSEAKVPERTPGAFQIPVII